MSEEAARIAVNDWRRVPAEHVRPVLAELDRAERTIRYMADYASETPTEIARCADFCARANAFAAARRLLERVLP